SSWACAAVTLKTTASNAVVTNERRIDSLLAKLLFLSSCKATYQDSATELLRGHFWSGVIIAMGLPVSMRKRGGFLHCHPERVRSPGTRDESASRRTPGMPTLCNAVSGSSLENAWSQLLERSSPGVLRLRAAGQRHFAQDDRVWLGLGQNQFPRRGVATRKMA